MDPDLALEVARKTLMTTLILVAPLLGVGLIVGVIISIFQAVTQIQEMTLTFVPKIIAMVLVAILLMPWMMSRLSAFAIEMFGPMPVP